MSVCDAIRANDIACGVCFLAWAVFALVYGICRTAARDTRGKR